MNELEHISLTLDIEPVALRILEYQADWQHVTLEQLAVQYIGRCAAVVEEQYGNALVSDAFNPLIERARQLQAARDEAHEWKVRYEELLRIHNEQHSKG